jgi:uncharacterized cupredoxin-like copper-binding protein
MKRVMFLLAVPVLAVLAACGSSDELSPTAAPDDARVIEVEMRDVAFAPTEIDVRAGEKVRFVFTNTGQVTHDAFIGDQAAQEEHEKEMRGGHGDHGKGSNAVSVKPGKTAELTHTFDQPGQMLIGCHQPGHYTGGMKVTVNIA